MSRALSFGGVDVKGEKVERLWKDVYPDSLLFGGCCRVVRIQALRVIAVTALIALEQLLLRGEGEEEERSKSEAKMSPALT